MTTTPSCQERRNRMLYNVPMPRNETISPYINSNLTKHDLDMRRKAEILKYSGPQNSNYVKNLTKSEKFAQLVRGNSPTQKMLTKTIPLFCDSSMNLYLTSSSDVPGPIIPLYLDNNIPLYNFAKPNKVFGENRYEERY